MKKLFMIGLGGKAHNANMEVHDIQFVAADKIEDTTELLSKNWYGYSLHIDEYKWMDGIEGYQILLRNQPSTSALNLYFVHMGGYFKDIFGEQHAIGLLAATTEEEAREKGKCLLPDTIQNLHVDQIRKVENHIQRIDEEPLYIHLIPDTNTYSMSPDWSGYWKLF